MTIALTLEVMKQMTVRCGGAVLPDEQPEDTLRRLLVERSDAVIAANNAKASVARTEEQLRLARLNIERLDTMLKNERSYKALAAKAEQSNQKLRERVKELTKTIEDLRASMPQAIIDELRSEVRMLKAQLDACQRQLDEKTSLIDAAMKRVKKDTEAREKIAAEHPELAIRDHVHPLEIQIRKLANFIVACVPGEPSRNLGAVDTAIGIIASKMDLKLTGKQWNDALGDNISDPDGWDRRGTGDKCDYFKSPITLDDYRERMMKSSICPPSRSVDEPTSMPKEKLEAIVEDAKNDKRVEESTGTPSRPARVKLSAPIEE